MNANATLSPEQKEFLIEEALKTEAGRMALASSMANPIRLTLDYQGIGRKLLVVDPLPQGALPVYDKDVKIPVITIGKRGSAPDTIVEGERITVGTWEIISYPQVRFSQVKERRYNLIDRAQQRAKLDLMAEEDRNVFNGIDRSSNLLNPETTVANQLTRDALVSGLSEVGKWDLVPAKFVMNFSEYSDLMKFGRDQFDPVTQREVLQTGLVGHLWTLDILVSKVVPRGTIWVIAEPEFTGVMPIRQDVNVLPADKPERLRLGWVVYEELGIAVVNPRAVSRINVTGKPTFVPF